MDILKLVLKIIRISIEDILLEQEIENGREF